MVKWSILIDKACCIHTQKLQSVFNKWISNSTGNTKKKKKNRCDQMWWVVANPSFRQLNFNIFFSFVWIACFVSSRIPSIHLNLVFVFFGFVETDLNWLLRFEMILHVFASYTKMKVKTHIVYRKFRTCSECHCNYLPPFKPAQSQLCFSLVFFLI